MTRYRPVPALLALPLLALLLAGCGDDGPEQAGDDGSSPSTTAGTTASPTAGATASPTPAPTPAPTPGRYPDFAPTDYSFTLTLTCYCPDAGVPIRVTVEDDEVVEAVYARGGGRGGAVAGEDVPPGRAATIDEVIEAANTPDAYRVEVDWPEGQDHPTSVSVDRSRMTVDEEIGYQVADVVVTSP